MQGITKIHKIIISQKFGAIWYNIVQAINQSLRCWEIPLKVPKIHQLNCLLYYYLINTHHLTSNTLTVINIAQAETCVICTGVIWLASPAAIGLSMLQANVAICKPTACGLYINSPIGKDDLSSIVHWLLHCLPEDT